MLIWIVFIAGAVVLIGNFVLSRRDAVKTEQQDAGIKNNKIDIMELADEFRTFQQLNIQDKFEKYTEQKYGLTKVGYDKLLSDNILYSKSQLNKALAYYLSNNNDNAIPVFTELIKETNPFEIRAISNSYLGRIGVSKANYSKETIDYLIQAENLFKKFKTDDNDVIKVRASNFYDLGFYYKTHSHNFKLSQYYYLNSIDIYENINDIVSGIYSSKLGSVYNDLYILTQQGNLEGNPLLLLQRAIFYKGESLDKNDKDNDNFINYINSLQILANYYRMNGDYTNSTKTYEKTIGYLDDKILENPLDKRILLTKAESLVRFSELYQTKYSQFASKEDLTEAKLNLDAAELLFHENTKDKVTLYDAMQFQRYYYSKGTLSRCLNDYPQALKDFNKSLEFADTLSSHDINDIDYILLKANIFYEIAITYKNFPKNRDCAKAKYYAEKALFIYEENIKSRKFYKSYLEECKRIIKQCN